MKQVQASVIENIAVAPGIFLVKLRAPEVAMTAEPGQFVQVRCLDSFDPLLRRPLSVHRIGRYASPGLDVDALALLVQVVGRGTDLLSKVRSGDSLDVVGPLGQGFDLKPTTRRLLLVAGGVGIAPLVAAADLAIRRDVEVTILAGARTGAMLLPPVFLPPEAEYVVATDDGSQGHYGMITALLPEYLQWPDQVFVCGPRPMLEAVAVIGKGRRESIQVSLEERMACGVGACLGCAVDTKHGQRTVCRDGPVFELMELKL